MTDIAVSARYPTKTYTFEPFAPEGEWRAEADGTRICANYRVETVREDGGILVRAWFTNTRTETVRLADFCFAGRWQESIETCVTYETTPVWNRDEMGSPCRTIRLLPFGRAESCDFLLFRDARGTAGVIGAASCENCFSDIRLDAEGAFLLTFDCEDIPLAPGKTAASDWFCISWGESAEAAAKAHLGRFARRQGLKAPRGPAPTGWCSWYYYLGHISESDIAENLEFLAQHKKDLPVKVVQTDDGWFDRRGDWNPNGRFPDMKGLADKIRAEGYVPGLWLCPFSADRGSRVARGHPDWMIQRPDGSGPAGEDSFALDPTNPAAAEYLAGVIRRITSDWGFGYLKLDYLLDGTRSGVRHDKTATSAASMRRGLSVVREAAGPDVYLLACTACLAPPAGICDGIRTGPDVAHNWDSLRTVYSRVLKRWFWNGSVYNDDPDCLMVRTASEEDGGCFRRCVRTENEIGVYLTAAAAAGGLWMLSDKLTLLKPRQTALLGRFFPPNGRAAVPLDLFDSDIPGVLDFGEHSGVRTAALINWGDSARDMTLPAALTAGRTRAKEFWTGEEKNARGEFTVRMEPRTARVWSFA